MFKILRTLVKCKFPKVLLKQMVYISKFSVLLPRAVDPNPLGSAFIFSPDPDPGGKNIRGENRKNPWKLVVIVILLKYFSKLGPAPWFEKKLYLLFEQPFFLYF